MISVIIPVYNVEKYVGYCLGALEVQTYKDFEVVLVNDGSKDGSLEAINKYLETSSLKAKVVSQENAGVSAARNRGIVEAEGDYFTFIDSDDMLHPEALQRHLSNILDRGADMSICGRCELEESAEKYDGEIEIRDVEIYEQRDALERLLYGRIKVGMPSVLCKREVLGDIRFAEGVAYGEDLEVLWKTVSRSAKIAFDRTELYGYRIYGSSAMGTMTTKRLAGMKLFEKLEKYFDEELPDFAELFRKYGVARWVWATIWQAAVAANSYKAFKESVKDYEPRKKFKKLLSYPDTKVRLSCAVYVVCPFAYYRFVRAIRKKLRKVT